MTLIETMIDSTAQTSECPPPPIGAPGPTEQLAKLRQMEAIGHQIKAKVRDLGKKETAVAEADAARKTAMEARNTVQKQLDELHDELATLAMGKHTERLFPPQNDAKAPEPGEAWRSVDLSTLTPQLTPGKLKALREHEPSIRTVGDWADWCEKKGQFAVKDVKGLGEKGGEQLALAMESFWEQHPELVKQAEAEKAEAAPAADEQFDDAQIIDYTCEKIIESPGRYLIDIAQRNGGRWTFSASATVGKKSFEIDGWWQGSFPDRAAAIKAAAEKVWEFADGFIKNPKTPKKQRDHAKEISRAIDRLDKSLVASPEAQAQADVANHARCNKPKQPIEEISEAIKGGRRGRKAAS